MCRNAWRHWRVDPARRSRFYLQAIDARDPAVLRQALGRASASTTRRRAAGRHFADLDQRRRHRPARDLRRRAVRAEVERLHEFCRYGLAWPEVVDAALIADLDERLFAPARARLADASSSSIDLSAAARRLEAEPSLPLARAGRRLAGRSRRRGDRADCGCSWPLQRLWSADCRAGCPQPAAPCRRRRAAPTRCASWPIVARAARWLRGWRCRAAGARPRAAYEQVLRQLKDAARQAQGPAAGTLALPYVLSLLAAGLAGASGAGAEILPRRKRQAPGARQTAAGA